MRKFSLLILLFMIVVTMSCNGQPTSQYEIVVEAVPNTTQYYYFIEQDLGQTPLLQQDMDYLAPNVTSLQLGVSSSTTWTLTLPNDRSNYILGVVAVDSQGFYSGMGVANGQTFKVPNTPGGIILRKK